MQDMQMERRDCKIDRPALRRKVQLAWTEKKKQETYVLGQSFLQGLSLIWCLQLLQAVMNEILPSIKDADLDASSLSTGTGSLLDDGRTPLKASNESPKELIAQIDRAYPSIFRLPQEGLGKDNLLDVVRMVLDNSVNTWCSGFMDKLYASTNAVRYPFLLKSSISVFGHVTERALGRLGLGTAPCYTQHQCPCLHSLSCVDPSRKDDHYYVGTTLWFRWRSCGRYKSARRKRQQRKQYCHCKKHAIP